MAYKLSDETLALLEDIEARIDPETEEEYRSNLVFVAVVVQASPQVRNGNSQEFLFPMQTRNTFAVTPTRVTPVRSWTVPFWRVTPTRSSRLWLSQATLSVLTRVTFTFVQNIRLQSNV